MTRGIVTAGGGHGWETGLVAALGTPGAPMTVVRRCADMADVLAVASTGQVSGAVIAAGMRGLTGESVLELTSFRVAVVVVRDAADDRTAVLAERIGAAGTVADDLLPDEMAIEVGRLLTEHESRRQPAEGDPGVVADPSLALPLPRHAAEDVSAAAGHVGEWVPGSDPAGVGGDPARAGGIMTRGLAERAAAAKDAGRPRGRRRRSRAARHPVGDAADPVRGTIIAVWGPRGAPGRSTVAIGLADRLTVMGRRVLIMDADVYGGVLSSALGLLDESAGLAGACRLAATGRLDADRLAELCWSVEDRLTVLTGISRADRWPEVRPSAIPVILDTARSLAEVVVIDCAALLEADEEVSFDTMAPRRNGATLAAIAAADIVLAIGSADPPGLERLVRGLEELGEAVPSAAPYVVFNRVRDSAASPAELTAALRRFAGLAPTAFLPEDRVSCDAAWGRGQSLSVVAAKSALTRSFDNLARSVLG